MIKRYTDHAANERTFLAWVRTAIAVMAFGFLVERFDFFMSATAGSSPRTLTLRAQQFANEVGLAFILLGVAMIVIATIRFFRVAREIDRDDVVHSAGSLFECWGRCFCCWGCPCFCMCPERYCRRSSREPAQMVWRCPFPQSCSH